MPMVDICHQRDPSQSRASGAPLQQLITLATALDLPALATEVSAFAERIAGGRFYVGCVGQFKRGKSTLLNALLGEAILPAGVVPVTSAVTVVRYGSPRHATIHLLGGASRDVALKDIPAYVAEPQNPENVKGVAAVEVFVPSDLLASGMCLVDTPGIGSVFLGNSRATQAFVPHIDAALVVLGADPPISADEIALVDAVARQSQELIFVLNKADRVSDAERQEAKEFCEQVLASRLGRSASPILEVGATERLTGGGPLRDWQGLSTRLATLAERSGSQLVRAAEDRGLRILGRRILREIAEREAALTRPLEESARRVEGLRRCAVEAERSMTDLAYLLTAEQERLHNVFAKCQNEFLERAHPAARDELLATLRHSHTASRSALWREGNRIAQDVFRRLVEAWRAEQQPFGNAVYRDATKRFIELANAFLERVATEGGLAMSDVPHVLGEERGFRTPSPFYFTELLYQTSRSPLRWLRDALRPRGSYWTVVSRHAVRYLHNLVLTNASRVTNALDEQVLESRRRLERDLRERLRDIYGVAERALERGRAQLAQGAEETRAELERLAALRHAAEQLLPAAESTSPEGPR